MEEEVHVPLGAQLVVTLIKARAVLRQAPRSSGPSDRHVLLLWGPQEYAVRAPKSTRRTFVGRFPGGKPGLSAAASGGAPWQMACSLGGGSVAHTLHLHGGARGGHYLGTHDSGPSGSSAAYYVFTLRGEGVIDAHPSGPWYTFRPGGTRPRTGGLTLEQAEERMEKAAQGGGGDGGRGHLLERLHTQAAATPVRATPAPRRPGGAAGGDASDSDLERRGDASGDESDSAGGAGPRGRRGRRGSAPGAPLGDGSDPPFPEAPAPGLGGFGEGEDREDWEHERAMTDDDEAVGVDDQIGEEEEPPAPPSPAALGKEEDERLDEAGRALQRMLKKQRKEEDRSSDEDGGSDEEDLVRQLPACLPAGHFPPRLTPLLATPPQAFEDEDFMDPDKDTRLTNILKEGPSQQATDRARIARPASQPALGAARGAGGTAPHAPAPASRAPQPPGGGASVVAAAGAKRPRSPDGQAAAPGEPAGKVARTDEAADASLAALEAVGITVSEFKAAIPASGITLKVRGPVHDPCLGPRMTSLLPPDSQHNPHVCCSSQEIMKRFKKRLHTATAKEAFTELMRRFTRFDQAQAKCFPKL